MAVPRGIFYKKVTQWHNGRRPRTTFTNTSSGQRLSNSSVFWAAPAFTAWGGKRRSGFPLQVRLGTGPRASGFSLQSLPRPSAYSIACISACKFYIEIAVFGTECVCILRPVSKHIFTYMTRAIFRLLILIVCISTVACTTTTVVSNKPLPPGQAKKITGSQSAKPFAPGQQKKQSTPAKGANKKN